MTQTQTPTNNLAALDKKIADDKKADQQNQGMTPGNDHKIDGKKEVQPGAGTPTPAQQGDNTARKQ